MYQSSPLIAEISWGRVSVNGYRLPFKDVKLFPGGAREWDWTETGTRHVPGIQTGDVVELVENGAEIVILSQGMQKRLRVAHETAEYLEDIGVEVIILPTREAVDQYNMLAKSERVGALIHSTC